MNLPFGWRFEPATEKPCPHCNGVGKVPGTAAMIAPSGLRIPVFGSWTKAIAADYARMWAPERCSPQKRAELYGA